MSILKANLKHLYQRRGLWFVYALICMLLPVFIAGMIRNAGQNGLFAAFLVLSNVIGLFACSMQIDVAVKPFSFCFPGYRRVKRQFLMIVAIVSNLLLSLLLLLYPDIGADDKMFAVTSAFFAGMISFWIGVLIAFTGSLSAGFMGFYPVIGILAAKYDLHIVLEKAIVFEPGLICLLGIAVSIAAWMLLACEGWVRRHCGANWLGFFDAWNWSKARKNSIKKVSNLEDGALSGMFERFCLGCVRNAPMRIKSHLAGSVYATFGAIFCKKPSSIFSIFFILLIVCALGYIKSMANMIYIFAGIMAINVRMPVHSTLLVAGGRNERFMETCFMTFVISAFISVVIVLIVLLSWGIAGFMPPLYIDGNIINYHPVTLLGFYVPFIMVPVGFTIQLICKRKQMPMMVAWVMFFVFCMIAAIIMDGSSFWVYAVIALLTGSWFVFLAVLRWVCVRQTLVI